MDQQRRRSPGTIVAALPPRRNAVQDPSRYWSHPWLDLGKRLVLGARIFFRTRESDLDCDDRLALMGLADALRPILENGHDVELVCRGYADIRWSSPSNYRLSVLREQSVTSFLRQCLGHQQQCTFSGRGLGDLYASPDSTEWSHDRRVDVFVRVTPSFAKGDPASAKRRAVIFRTYYPGYARWTERGLDYLVDEYELHDQDDVPVQIRPTDFDKVLELVLLVADPVERPRIERVAYGPRRREAITEAYSVEYRKAYEEAYRRYRAAESR